MAAACRRYHDARDRYCTVIGAAGMTWIKVEKALQQSHQPPSPAKHCAGDIIALFGVSVTGRAPAVNWPRVVADVQRRRNHRECENTMPNRIFRVASLRCLVGSDYTVT